VEFQFRLGLQSVLVSNGQELIESLMNLTDPSPNAQLTPSGCRLNALEVEKSGSTIMSAFGGAVVPTRGEGEDPASAGRGPSIRTEWEVGGHGRR
jgi:hypothetical protein